MKFNSFTQVCTELLSFKPQNLILATPKLEITVSWEKGGNLGQINSLWHHIEMLTTVLHLFSYTK